MVHVAQVCLGSLLPWFMLLGSVWGVFSHGSCSSGLFGESSAMVHAARVCLGSLQPWFM